MAEEPEDTVATRPMTILLQHNPTQLLLARVERAEPPLGLPEQLDLIQFLRRLHLMAVAVAVVLQI